MLKNLTLIFLLVAGVASGQKLPNVQEQPLRAPSGIKIDGKTSEWAGKFQAKNSATEITYAMSNDDENLYLVFQTAIADVVSLKIMRNGLTLKIHRSGKKNDKDVASITYPVFDGQRPLFFWNVGSKGMPLTPDQSAKATDSLLKAYNNKISNGAKWIITRGIPSVDSLESVYNDDGIKAAGLFDATKTYSCEIAIPLKHLGLSAGTVSKFAYHILLNYNPNSGAIPHVPVIFGITRPDGTPVPEAEVAQANAKLTAGYATTDFWGEYTLATKP